MIKFSRRVTSRSQKSEVGSRSEQLVGDCNSPLIEDR
jgi:hypothetical protein